ncbi:hypothetical protein [Niabella aquatica]
MEHSEYSADQKYQIPEGHSNKRALNKESIKPIFEYEVDPNDYLNAGRLIFENLPIGLAVKGEKRFIKI